MQYLTLKDYFLLIEDEQVLPGIQAYIPELGEISNLYNFGFNCLAEIIDKKSLTALNQLNILFTYLVNNELITVTKKPAPVYVPEIWEIEPSPTKQPIKEQQTALTPPAQEPEPTPELWDLNFNFSNLPNGPIRLSQCEVIHDLPKFIDTHLQTCQRNNGNYYFLPFYNRLLKLEQILNNK